MHTLRYYYHYSFIITIDINDSDKVLCFSLLLSFIFYSLCSFCGVKSVVCLTKMFANIFVFQSVVHWEIME